MLSAGGASWALLLAVLCSVVCVASADNVINYDPGRRAAAAPLPAGDANAAGSRAHSGAANRHAPLDVQEIGAAIVGGLALLLYGISRMAHAVRCLCGDRIGVVVAKLARTPLHGFVSGTLGAAAMQSSTALVLLVLSFVATPAAHQPVIMTFEQSVPVLLGAQIGSTLVNQLVTFKLSTWALYILAAGWALARFARAESLVAWGTFVFGLGLLFHGNEILARAITPLRHHADFLAMLASIEHPLAGSLVACVVTVLIQTSAATISVTQMLARLNVVSLRTGLAFVVGANVGTASTAIVACIGTNADAVCVAVCFLLIKLLPACVTLPLLPQLESITRAVSPDDADSSRLIANAHTLWNVIVSFLFLPFTAHVARGVRLLVGEPAGAKVTKL
jgi:phosphate:Na+ symporter